MNRTVQSICAPGAPYSAIAVALLLLAVTGSARAATISETIGNLPPGKSSTITFSVTVNPAIPNNVFSVSQQGQVTSSSFPSTVLTDDPATPAAADPTITTVTHGPDLTITKTHSGNFTQGDTGRTYTLTVTNSGGVVTDGTQVTVVDTLPAGLTATAFTGNGWTTNLGTLTATRTDPLGAGLSYPVLTLTVSVASTSPASVTNVANVSGGGDTNSANNGASDPTTIIQMPTTITATGGTPQSTTVNTAFATALQATVVDAAGVGVQGVSVTFTAPGSGASGTFSNSTTTVTATTGPGGILSEAFTANTISGSYTVSAAAAGVATPASFSLTNNPGAPASITATAGTPQTATANTAFATALQATVKDGFGNPVSGISVTFTAPSSGQSGTFSNGTATITGTTNSSGILSEAFTANAIGGNYSVTAAAAGIVTPASFSLTNTASADLSISASGPAFATAGDPTGFNYVLTVTNNGPSANAGGFTVTDTLPPGLTFQPAGSTPGASVAGPTITYTNVAGLGSNGTATFTLHVILAANAASGSTLSNSATVATTGTADFNTPNNTSNTVSTTVQTSADLSISKAGPSNVVAGDPNGFNYVLTVTNNGPSDNTGGFTLTDVLPPQVVFLPAGSTPGAVVNNQTITYTSAGLANASQAIFTLHVKLAANVVSGAVSNGSSVATNGTTDPGVPNNTSNTVTTNVVAPDLTATLSDNVSQATTLGNNWTWTIHVANGGNSPALFASGQRIIFDNLPNANIAYGAVSVANASGLTGTVVGSITANDLTATASGGSVSLAAAGSFDLVFTATPSAIGVFANPRAGGSASVDPDNVSVESNENNNTFSDTVTVTAPDLTATKTNNVSGSTPIGGNWTWTIHVANSGNSPAVFTTGQRILFDNLPNANVVYGAVSVANPVGVTGTVAASITASDLTARPIGGSVTLAAPGSFDLVFTATPSAVATYLNPRAGGVALVDPDSHIIESNEANNTFTDTVGVTGADLTATLTDNVSQATTLGNNWQWKIHVANSGVSSANFTAGQRIVFDNLPNANIAYGAVSVANATGLTGTVVGTITANDLTAGASGGSVTLAVGGSFDLLFTATPSAIGTFANPRAGGTASVDPDNVVGETNEANNTFSDTVTVTAPDLTATMSDNVANATTLGNNWTWTIHVANGGNAPAVFSTGQTLVLDNLPNANLTYGGVSIANASGLSGTVAGTITANDLTAVANGGSATLNAGGSFDVVFTATPTAIGTFASPRGGGTASVDPNNNVTESNEGNNSFSDTVTVTAPDLTATLTDNVSNATTLGNNWTWTIHVANSGNAPAVFASGQRIVFDNLPNANIVYGAVSVANPSGLKGTVLGSITSSDLTAVASGGIATLAAGGSFDLVFTATPSVIGSYANPRAGGSASVDPDNVVVESNEGNNTFSDTVVVTAPDLVATMSNNVSGATTLGSNWTWTIHFANNGNAPANFANGAVFFAANLPNSNISYSGVSILNVSGLTGGVTNSSISPSGDLTVSAVAAPTLSLAAGGSFDAVFTATPTAVGTFTTPRAGGTALVDPGNVVVESNETNNTFGDSVNVTGADLTATKTDNVNHATTLGNSWTWTIHVSNIGASSANFSTGQRILLDNLPNASIAYSTVSVANATGVTGTVAASISASDLTATASGGSVSIAVGGSFDLVFTATPSAIGTYLNPRPGGGPGPILGGGIALPTVAKVDPDNVVPESNENNNTFSDIVVVTAPDLTATQTDNVNHATTYGNSWTWTIHVANAGNSPAIFAAGQRLVLDNLPDTNITYGSVNVANASGLTGTVVSSITANDLTTVASGGTVSLAPGGSFDLVFSATPTDIGTFTSPRAGGSATVDPDNVSVESNEANNSFTDTVVVTAPDMTITKSHSASFRQGDLGRTYTITVTNSGNAPTSTPVTVTDVLPAGLTPTATDTGVLGGWTVSFAGQTVTATRSDVLPAGSSYAPLILTVNVDNNAPANLTNVATVSGGGEVKTSNDSASDPTSVIQVADMIVAKTHTGNFEQGQTGATYTLTVTNAGPGSTSAGVSLTDTLPAGLTATAFSGTGWTVDLPSLTATRSDVLASGANYPQLTLTVNVSTTAAATLVNSAVVSGGGELNAANDSATDSTTILPALAITTLTLPGGTVYTPYSQTIQSSGGLAPVTFSVSAGTLPTGLTLNSATGVISGTPQATGTFPFTIKAGDALNVTAQQSYSVVIVAPTIAISPATLAGGKTGVAYSAQFSATGGQAAYTFAVASGSLPAGLTLTAAGSLSGVPTAGGSFTFAIKATDSSTGTGPYTGTQSYTLVIDPATIVIAPATLPNTTVSLPYNQTLTASGGTAPYTFAVTAGTLPPGLALTSTGTLSGIATTSAVYNFTITATDSSTGTGPFSGMATYTVTVDAGTLFASNPTATPNPLNGLEYTFDAHVGPSKSIVVTWNYGDGSALDTGPVRVHTYPGLGIYTVTVTATDGLRTETVTLIVQISANGTNPIVMEFTRGQLKFNFSTHRDSLSLTGYIPLPVNFAPAGKVFTVSCGTYSRNFTLDSKGRSGTASDNMNLSGQLRNGVFQTNSAVIRINSKNQDLFDALKGYGFQSGGIDTAQKIRVTVTVSFGAAVLVDTPTFLYKAKNGKGGGTLQKR